MASLSSLIGIPIVLVILVCKLKEDRAVVRELFECRCVLVVLWGAVGEPQARMSWHVRAGDLRRRFHLPFIAYRHQ